MAVFSGLNLSSADDILKVDYQDAIRDQLDNINVVWAMMEKKTVPHRGKDFYVALRTDETKEPDSEASSKTFPNTGTSRMRARYLSASISTPESP